ncbi:hypothetical protein [Tunturiibacter gelidoferens]|uniref:Uncharacterized protein n=1 Tax=Tunturiibacter lichenicola TaxID=2051959 RepID=A0A7Y9NN47_9BACT|nr:hypothetical protein [Edaphobacter lichenicola]NYF52449.1 hypothetical protein [Edaphobacter lichenicola]
MHQLTEKQKKIALIVGAVLLAIHFAPGFINNLRHAAPAPAVVQKQSAAHVAPAPPPPPPSPEIVAAAKYGGIWAGSELMPDQNRCSIRIEIRLSDDTKRLKGYESKTCIPTQPFAGGKGIHGQSVADVMRETAPVSAVMTGAPVEGGIRFTVDSLIGTPYDGYSLIGMTITDFGQGQVQAQWQSQRSPQAPCPDNRMLLKKARG